MQLEGACPSGRGQGEKKESGESGIQFLFCIILADMRTEALFYVIQEFIQRAERADSLGMAGGLS